MPLSVGLTLVQRLGGDARHESLLVDSPRGRLVLKAVSARVDVARFLEAAQALQGLEHASLRPVRGVGVLGDGRPYVLVDELTAPPLHATLAPERALVLGLQLASALARVHAAGVVLGGLGDGVLYDASPAVLDASLAGLAGPGSSAASDTRSLAELLRAAVSHAGPLGVALRAALEGPEDAADLERALRELSARVVTVTDPSAPLDTTPMEADLAGNVVGAWRLGALLGEGAMGRVYLAQHERDGRRAAVKVLRAEHAHNPELVHRFVQEARALEAIHHPHLVEIFELGELEKPDGAALTWCAMEVLEGESLADAVARGPLLLRRVARIGQQVARALHAAHEVGVVHRDVKPENIMVTTRVGGEDFVKVLDFGMAKLLQPLGDLPSTRTLGGTVVGTPEYMAPEQALGASADARSDLYAVGLVLYELITGGQPFRAESFGKLVVAMTQQPPPPLPEVTRLGERVPPGLGRVVFRLLAKEPEERFPSGEAVARALEPYVAEVLPVEPAEPVKPRPEAEEEALVLPRTSRAGRLVRLGVVLAALAALLGLARALGS